MTLGPYATSEDRVWKWVLEQQQQTFCGDDGQGNDDDETLRLRSHFSVASSVVSELADEEEEEFGEEPTAVGHASFGLDDLVREIEAWQAADALLQRAAAPGVQELRPRSAGNEATQKLIIGTREPSARIRWGTRRNRGGEDDTMLPLEPLLVQGRELATDRDPEPCSSVLSAPKPQPFVARRVLSLPAISPSTLAPTSAPPLFPAGPHAEPITMASRKYNHRALDTIAPSSFSPPSAGSKLRSRSSDMDLRAAFSSKKPVLLRGPASSESSATTASSSSHSARGHFPLLPNMDSITSLLRSRASVVVESRASALKISAPLTAPATPPKDAQRQHQRHARSPSGSSLSESSCDSDSAGVLTPNTSYTNFHAPSPQQRPAKFNLDRALPPLPPLELHAQAKRGSLLSPQRRPMTPPTPSTPSARPQRPKRPPLNKREISLPMSVDAEVAEQILATPPRAAPSPADYEYPRASEDEPPRPASANPYALEVKRAHRLSDVPAGLVRSLSRSRPTSPTRPPMRRPRTAGPPSSFSNPLGALVSARASMSSLTLSDATGGLKRALSFSRSPAALPEPAQQPKPLSPPPTEPVHDAGFDSDSDFELVAAPRGYFAYSTSSSAASSPGPKLKPQKKHALLIRSTDARELSFEAVRQWAAREGEIGRMEALGRRRVRVVFRDESVCGRWCVRGRGEVDIAGVGRVALEVVRVK